MPVNTTDWPHKMRYAIQHNHLLAEQLIKSLFAVANKNIPENNILIDMDPTEVHRISQQNTEYLIHQYQTILNQYRNNLTDPQKAQFDQVFKSLSDLKPPYNYQNLYANLYQLMSGNSRYLRYNIHKSKYVEYYQTGINELTGTIKNIGDLRTDIDEYYNLLGFIEDQMVAISKTTH